ncbi:MAG: DegT/DnrJ/EryC1/StrS family aminotransferase, partial [Gordonibacter sp.]|uniref:DegT/DnrJ/EryC1/StrS family aminotransferase n=1 Tax=Gordonibacter sp. TaxID=1968902 RepID=UPI002FC6232D
WKCNMTDIQAALGLTQLRRYPSLLARRREMIERYEAGLTGLDVSTLTHFSNDSISSGHLMLVHMNGKDEAFRNAVIEHMAQAGVATNVHYKPLPLLSAYRNLGFSIDDFPNAYELFRSEITFPLHTLLTNDDIDYVLAAFKNAYVAVANEV